MYMVGLVALVKAMPTFVHGRVCRTGQRDANTCTW